MSSTDANDLFTFLSTQTAHTKFWKANRVYHFGSDQITLSHDIVWRKRKENKPGNRYEVISTNQTGKGTFGLVYDIRGTLALNTEIITFKQEKKPRRVVKIQIHSKKNPAKRLQNEYQIAKIATHLAIKEPTQIDKQSYTIMKKIDGVELHDIINDDLTCRSILSLEQRVALCIAILKAYREQLASKEIIHRDIKPANILVNLKHPVTVNFIDFGASTLAISPDIRNTGTPGYKAPEISAAEKPTAKIDIFSLARVLALLWRNNLASYQANAIANNATYNQLFEDLDGLSAADQAIIKLTLEKMSARDPLARITIEQAILAFESISLKNQIPATSEKPLTAQEHVNNINALLKALRLKSEDLRDRGFQDLGQKCSTLANQIEEITKKFHALQPEVRKNNVNQYLQACNDKIAPLKLEMAEHRDSNYLFANLLLAIAGLGLFYMIAISCNKVSTGNWLFFSKPKSLELAENIENSVQQIASVSVA